MEKTVHGKSAAKMSRHPALFAVSGVGAVCKIIPVSFIAFDQFHDELTGRQRIYTPIPFLLSYLLIQFLCPTFLLYDADARRCAVLP
jgi:hypothetical protein